MRHVAVLSALFTATPASATPTYLLCSFAKGPDALDVTADEANGQVTTLVQATGFMERRPAVFTPENVKWSSPGGMEITYSLSRVDLSLNRVLMIGPDGSPDTGHCKLKAPPKRAF